MHRHGQPHCQKRMLAPLSSSSIPEKTPKSLLKIATCRGNRHSAKTDDDDRTYLAMRFGWTCGRAVQALKQLQNTNSPSRRCPSGSSWHRTSHILRGLPIAGVSSMIGPWYKILLCMWVAIVRMKISTACEVHVAISAYDKHQAPDGHAQLNLRSRGCGNSSKTLN